MLLVVEAEGIDDLAQTNPVADGVLQRWIILLDNGDDLVAAASAASGGTCPPSSP